jgi:hypothetical protein
MITQSVSWWCFTPRLMTPEAFVRAVVAAGLPAIDLVPPEYWDLVRAHGLLVSSFGGHQTLELGLNRRDQHDRIEAELRVNIKQAARIGCPTLVCFSGNRNGLGDAEGAEVTAEALARVAPLAEAGASQALRQQERKPKAIYGSSYEKAGGEPESPSLARAMGSCPEDCRSHLYRDLHTWRCVVVSVARFTQQGPPGSRAYCSDVFPDHCFLGDCGDRIWRVASRAQGRARSGFAWLPCRPVRGTHLTPSGCAFHSSN